MTKQNKRRIILAAVNGVFLAGVLVFSLIGSAAAKSQEYNYAAERWQNGDDTDDYTQISCFLPESSGFSVDSINAVRAGILSALQTISVVPEEGQKLCPDAYSTPLGSTTVRGDLVGRSEAEITAVGGDFFMIHDFKLINGSFFSDEDVMQDGVVIDRTLAWELYGSYEVSGMNLTINGTRYYISGVIENPQTKEEIKCSGELPRAYISFDGASGFDSSPASGVAFDDPYADEGYGTFMAVMCYEILMPDPVENYAYSSVKSLMESYNNAAVVQNTDRFDSSKRVKAIKKISMTAVKDSDISYPFWENASRIVEFRLSFIYLWRRLCMIVPFATLAWLIIRGYIAFKRNKRKAVETVLRIIKKIHFRLRKGETNEPKDK